MYQNRLSIFLALLNELKYLLSHFVLLMIKQHLILRVVPVEGQVDDAETLPQIIQLAASTVNDSGNFIRKYEFKVLHAETEM